MKGLLFRMMNIGVGAAFLAGGGILRAQEAGAFSGKLSLETGFHQAAGEKVDFYHYSRILLESRNDLLPALTLGFSAEYDWQTSSLGLAPSWPLYPAGN